jgi:hypothetical protein
MILKASGKVNRGICGFVSIVVVVVCYAQHCLQTIQAAFWVLLLRAIDVGCGLAMFVHGIMGFGRGWRCNFMFLWQIFLFFTYGCGGLLHHNFYHCDSSCDLDSASVADRVWLWLVAHSVFGMQI